MYLGHFDLFYPSYPFNQQYSSQSFIPVITSKMTNLLMLLTNKYSLHPFVVTNFTN